MIEYIDISTIKPASYNPRKISEEQFEHLQESVKLLGMISPILVNSKNNTIIAGHQRTKACKAVGVTRVPAIFIDGVEIGDEIKFNQIHNAIDKLEEKKTYLRGDFPVDEFFEADSKDFTIGGTSAAYVKEICKLMNKYGNSLSCIVCKGEVITGENYAYACKLLNVPVNTMVVPDEKYEILKSYIYQDYGEYSYDNIKRNTFVQGLAQMHRLGSQKEGGRLNKSCLYENMVLPYMKNDKYSILDFGCGKAAYITSLKKRHEAVGIEFYNNNGHSIIVSKGNKMIDDFIMHVKEKGVFDIVVCDSVLNSVDSVKAENSVISCLNLFCKDNGKLFISGRPIDMVRARERMEKDTSNKLRYLEFLDDNNFTANFRKGQWYFQHFNEREQIIAKLNELGFRVDNVCWGKINASSWQIECTKVSNLTKEQYKAAVEFEFNLPLPNGRTYNRHKEVLELFNL